MQKFIRIIIYLKVVKLKMQKNMIILLPIVS